MNRTPGQSADGPNKAEPGQDRPATVTWNEPVQGIGAAHPLWLSALAPFYGRLLDLLYEGGDPDPMTYDHWLACRRRFDQGRDPETPEEANERFRELVVGVWKTLEGRWKREAQARAARRGRPR